MKKVMKREKKIAKPVPKKKKRSLWEDTPPTSPKKMKKKTLRKKLTKREGCLVNLIGRNWA